MHERHLPVDWMLLALENQRVLLHGDQSVLSGCISVPHAVASVYIRIIMSCSSSSSSKMPSVSVVKSCWVDDVERRRHGSLCVTVQCNAIMQPCEL